MATRKIIDIEHNGEKVWPKGHAKAIYMSDGRTVEDAINAGGGGGSGTITESEIAAMGFTKNPGTITEVKMNGVSKGTSGVVDLGDVQTPISDIDTIRSGAAKGATAVQPSDISEFLTSEDLAKVATSGNYNDLVDTPTIPSAVTESTVSGWGFTKNTGTYSKPSGGIPKSDLASDVQSSLDKANNSLQVEKFQEMDIVTVNGLAGGKSGLVYALSHESTGEEDDVLLSRGTVKTINGESILGEGDMLVGKITYFSEEDRIELSPNVVWMRRGSVVNSVQITGFASNGKDYEEYAYHFYTGTIADGSTVKLILPKGVKYANKEIFDALESDTHYELSVVRSNGVVKAVLTAFK